MVAVEVRMTRLCRGADDATLSVEVRMTIKTTKLTCWGLEPQAPDQAITGYTIHANPG